jgi:hypothetical protein
MIFDQYFIIIFSLAQLELMRLWWRDRRQQIGAVGPVAKDVEIVEQ